MRIDGRFREFLIKTGAGDASSRQSVPWAGQIVNGGCALAARLVAGTLEALR